jgi:general nucleoside transport system ATP-binding protein
VVSAETAAVVPPVAAVPAVPPVVEVRGVTKAFPGVVANDGVTVAFYGGEVHCILGENGAGKSTLVNILSGMYRPDAGLVLVDGDEVDIGSPRAALDHGIGTVYQHSALIPVFTVLENLMVGRGRGLRLDSKAARGALERAAVDLGVEIDPEALAGGLSLGQQQLVEIVKALGSGSRVLVLDEPTSMLTPLGIAELEKVLLRLKSQGLAIVFITHKLREALVVGDRITILRRGRVVGELGPDVVHGRPRNELQAEIVGLMFGAEAATLADVVEVRAEGGTRRAARAISEHVSFELVDVSVEAGRGEVGLVDVSLLVHTGEIFGIAGVDGNGQRELAEAIAGQRGVHAGDILLDGMSIRHASVSKRQKLGLRYVTDDRLGEGTVSSLSVAQNLVLKRIGDAPFWRRGRIQEDAVADYAAELVDGFDIATPDVGTRGGTLSGGNVQKLVLARELSFEPRVVVFNKPTYGLDVKTTHAVRERIRRLAEDEGVAALLISTDLDELFDLCDRIAVLFRGRLTGAVENAPGAELEVGRRMIEGDSR